MKKDIALVPKVIYVPQREVVRLGKRWIVYLPQDYSEIWETVKSSGKKVRLYVEIVESN